MAEQRVFKKKSNLAGGSVAYRKWGEWKPGDMVVMRYQQAKPDNYDKFTYIGEVVDNNFDKSLIGKTMGLNSSGSLISAMEKIVPGDLFQLIYNGKETLSKGKYAGKEFHSMEIDLVEEEGEVNESHESNYDDEEESGEDFF